MSAPPAATATWLLAAGKPISAFEHLRGSSCVGASSFGEVAEALAEAGHDQFAYEAYECALQREIWAEEWIEPMCELDAPRALASLESIMADYPYESGETIGEVHGSYALCLHAVGRDLEAAELIGEPADEISEASGCVGTSIYGKAWEWETWKAARPDAVEAALLPVFESGSSWRGFALRHLLDVAQARGDEAAIRDLLSRYKGGGKDDPVLYATLMARHVDDTGWRELESLIVDELDEQDWVLPLADHLEHNGRAGDAFALRLAWLESDSNSTSAMYQLLREEPAVYTPLLDAHCKKLIASQPYEELDEELGELAYLYREIGATAGARTLFLRARELDPFDAEWWEAMRGMDPSSTTFGGSRR